MQRQQVISQASQMCNRNSLSREGVSGGDCVLWQKAQSQHLVSEWRGGRPDA